MPQFPEPAPSQVNSSWPPLMAALPPKAAPPGPAEADPQPEEPPSTARLPPTEMDLATLYRQHGPTVERWVSRLGGPQMDMMNLMHNVFILVDRHLRSF